MKAAPDSRLAKLNVVEMDLAKCKPHPRNPRRHPEPGTPEWDVLKASIEHDYFDPIVWNKRNGMLVSGHLRVKVMTEAGFRRADVVVVDYDEATHLARMSMANKQQGADNNVLLTELLQDIEKGGIALALAGFTRAGVDELATKAREEMDRNFLSGNGQPGSREPGSSITRNPDGETFSFVIVLTPEQHEEVIVAVNAAKEFFKVNTMQEGTLEIMRFFMAKKPAGKEKK